MTRRKGVVEVISSTNLRNNLSSVLKDAEAGNIKLIKRGKTAEVALIDAETLEDLLMAQDQDMFASIEQAKKDLEHGDTYTFEQIFGEI